MGRLQCLAASERHSSFHCKKVHLHLLEYCERGAITCDNLRACGALRSCVIRADNRVFIPAVFLVMVQESWAMHLFVYRLLFDLCCVMRNCCTCTSRVRRKCLSYIRQKWHSFDEMFNKFQSEIDFCTYQIFFYMHCHAYLRGVFTLFFKRLWNVQLTYIFAISYVIYLFNTLNCSDITEFFQSLGSASTSSRPRCLCRVVVPPWIE